MCGVDVEHLLHVFLDCNFAKDCWKARGFEFITDTIEYCPGWVLQFLSSEVREKSIQLAEVLWGIWVARNMKVWDNKTIPAEMAMKWSLEQCRQWRDAQASKSKCVQASVRVQQQTEFHWSAPDAGKFKINVDASVFPGASKFTVGMVLRDCQGQFCRARVASQGGEISVFEAETRGVLDAVKWAEELGLSQVKVESDSLITVQAIKGNAVNYLEVGNMLQECRTILYDHPDFAISYIRKQANKLAHLLARLPCEAYSFQDFLVPPQNVLEQLMYDVSWN